MSIKLKIVLLFIGMVILNSGFLACTSVMGKKRAESSRTISVASSSESESDEVKEVSIVTPERSPKKHRASYERKKEKELVRFLENRRLNSGYSDDSNVEDVVGHSRPVARRLFADPSPKNG